MPAPLLNNPIAPEISAWGSDLQGVPPPIATPIGAKALKRRTPKLELVTITVTKEDYAKLKAVGGPDPSYVYLALNHYLRLIKETGSVLTSKRRWMAQGTGNEFYVRYTEQPFR